MTFSRPSLLSTFFSSFNNNELINSRFLFIEFLVSVVLAISDVLAVSHDHSSLSSQSGEDEPQHEILLLKSV